MLNEIKKIYERIENIEAELEKLTKNGKGGK